MFFTSFKKRLNDPAYLLSANGWLAVFWAVNFPIVIGLYTFLPGAWQAMSILYLALVSVYANFVGHISSWQASRVEVEQARIEQEADEKNAKRDEELLKKIDEITPDA
jgi:hypothetical protein